MEPERVVFRPIGIIHSPHREPEEAPIQSAAARGAAGTVEILPEHAEGLRDLEGFERIWLVYWFHRARPPRLRVTPFLDTVERGVFATRSPARPNPIGLSPVRLDRVEGNLLHVRDLDVLDGTPLLDVKPYAPRFDCFEVSRCGWLEGVHGWPEGADGRFTRGPGEG